MKNRKHGKKTQFFKSKMLKGLCYANFYMLFPYIKITSRGKLTKQYQLTKNLYTIVLSILTKYVN